MVVIILSDGTTHDYAGDCYIVDVPNGIVGEKMDAWLQTEEAQVRRTRVSARPVPNSELEPRNGDLFYTELSGWEWLHNVEQS